VSRSCHPVATAGRGGLVSLTSCREAGLQ